MRALGYGILVLLLLLAVLPAPVPAAGVATESLSTMSAFRSSALPAYLTGGGNLAARKTDGVRAVRQRPSDVPAASAGTANTTASTPESLAAVQEVPEVFSLNSGASLSHKKFVSLGTSPSGDAHFIAPDILSCVTTPFQGAR
jgi:hypothetical protein